MSYNDKYALSLFISLILFCSNINKIKTLIFLPFNIKIKSENNDEFFSKYLSTKFEIGEPSQIIEAEIDFQESDFYLSYTKKYISLSYNKSKSNVYINTTQYRITTKNFMSGCKANETFYFFEDEELQNKKQYKNISFFMSANIDQLFCAVLGFELSYKGLRGFVPSLKSSKAINSYTWTLKFNSIDDGLLIIGDEPHIYNNLYDESKLKYTKVYMYKTLYSWSFQFSSLFIGESVDKINIIGVIRPDIQGLISPNEYLENIQKLFFNVYLNNNICKKIEIYDKNISNNDFYDSQNIQFYKIKCNKKKFGTNDIHRFPELKFLNIPINYTFSFNGKDLFKDENDYYIFQIYSADIKDWYFGRLFLYKYQLIFNEDNKLIGFYTGLKNISKKKINNLTKFILIVFFSVCFIFLSFIIYKKFRKFKNKKYANELEDNFSYRRTSDKLEFKSINNQNKKNENLLFDKND